MFVVRVLGFGVSVPLGGTGQWVLPSRVTETAVWSGVDLYMYCHIRADLTTWCDRRELARSPVGNED